MINESKTKLGLANHYLTLDIGPGASHNEIVHAYNRAKNTYSQGSLASYTLMDEGENTFILEEVEEAFLVLGNPSKRREYDILMGFNTWGDDEGKNHDNVSSADLLGKPRVKKSKKSSSTASRAPDASPPISSVAASIASVGGMTYEETSSPSATVIPMKPLTASSGSAIAKGDTPATTSTTPNGRVFAVGGVEFEPNPEFERQIAECEDLSGEFLKAVRIYRRYSPEALALRCKLSSSHVLVVENEDAAQMPQPVYLRGHVFLMCHALALPKPDRLAKKYVDRMIALGKIQKKVF